MAQHPFSEYRRMGKDALFIEIIESSKRFIKILWPFFLIILSKWGNLKEVLIISSIAVLHFILLPILMGSLRYYKTKLKVSDGNIYLRKSIIAKEAIIIPVDKVHALRIKRSPAYRLFDLASVSIDTIVDKQEELALIMTRQDLDDFVEAIDFCRDDSISVIDVGQSKEGTNEKHMEEGDFAEQKSVSDKSGDVIIRYSVLRLLLGASSQNHLKGIGVAFLLLSSMYSKFDSFINRYIDVIASKVEGVYNGLAFTSLVLIALLMYGVFLIAWNIKVLVRYYGLDLRIKGPTIKIESGLFTRRSTTINRDKIVAVIFKTNPLERMLNLSTLWLEMSKNALGSKREKNVFYAWREKDVIFNWANIDQSLEKVHRIRSGMGVFWIKFLPIWIPITFIIGVIFYFAQLGYWGMLAPLVSLLIGFAISLMYKKRSAISISNDTILIYGGAFSVEKTFLPMAMVENVVLRQSVFQRISNRATISFRTKGSTYSVRSIGFEDAKMIQKYVIYKVETSDLSTILSLHPNLLSQQSLRLSL